MPSKRAEFSSVSYLLPGGDVLPGRPPHEERRAVPERIDATRIVAEAELTWRNWDVQNIVRIKKRRKGKVAMKFIPDEAPKQELKVPFYEDASYKHHGIRGHEVTRSIRQLEGDIRSAMGRLGGTVTSITRGKYTDGDQVRDGIVIEFDYNGHPGRIAVAALPIKYDRTDKKVEGALAQALYNIHQILENQYNLLLLSPGSSPLLPYLLADGENTVAEMYEEQFKVPMLSPGRVSVVDGEVVE